MKKLLVVVLTVVMTFAECRFPRSRSRPAKTVEFDAKGMGKVVFDGKCMRTRVSSARIAISQASSR